MSFELAVEVGQPYVFVFVDSTAVGAAMAVAMFRANTLDTLSPQLAGHLDVGDVAVDPETQTAERGISYGGSVRRRGQLRRQARPPSLHRRRRWAAYNHRVDINGVVTAIEQFLRAYEGVVDTQVRPSGDDTDVIKIWVDLGDRPADMEWWGTTCEAAIRAAIPESAPFRLQVRAERDA
jgi:hypothetical protein